MWNACGCFLLPLSIPKIQFLLLEYPVLLCIVLMDRLKSEKISRSILYHSCLRNKMLYTHPFCVRPALSWMYLINLDSLTHCGQGRQNLMCGKLLLPGSCLFNFMNLRGGVQVSCLNAHFWAPKFRFMLLDKLWLKKLPDGGAPGTNL